MDTLLHLELAYAAVTAVTTAELRTLTLAEQGRPR